MSLKKFIAELWFWIKTLEKQYAKKITYKNTNSSSSLLNETLLYFFLTIPPKTKKSQKNEIKKLLKCWLTLHTVQGTVQGKVQPTAVY